MRTAQLGLAVVTRCVGVMCVVLQVFASSCTYVYKTEMQRGALLRTERVGAPETTGDTTLDLRCDLHRDGTLALASSRLLKRRQHLRQEFEQSEREYVVQRKLGDAVTLEVANVCVLAGLGHVLVDWRLGFPKACIGAKGEKNPQCEYTEKARPLRKREIENTWEWVDPQVSAESLGDGRFSLTLTSLSHADVTPISWNGQMPARGKADVDLQRLLPQDEASDLLEASATASRTTEAHCQGVVRRDAGEYHLDASDTAVADARRSLIDLKAEADRGRKVAAEQAAQEAQRLREAKRNSTECAVAKLKMRICELQSQIDQMQSVLDREQMVGLRSGYVDATLMHNVGSGILYTEEQRGNAFDQLRQYGADFSVARCVTKQKDGSSWLEADRGQACGD